MNRSRIKRKFKAVTFVFKKSKLINLILMMIFSVVFFLLFVSFVWQNSKKGFTPYINISSVIETLAPGKLISLSVPLSNINYEEEEYPEWLIYEYVKYDELFHFENSEDEIPEGSLPVIATTYNNTPNWLEAVEGVSINNEGKKNFDLSALINSLPAIKIKSKTEKPQVLIIHTHATESYNDGGMAYYLKENEYRSVDNKQNVVKVGLVVAEMLEKAGYKVIHDTYQHDNPDYNSSYTSSNKSIRSYLDKYPSIKVVLDIHRDTLITEKGVKYRPVANINGKQSAQVMILLGAGNSTYINSHWKDNLKFAIQIQKTASAKYPELMRPILLRNSRYNQHLSKGGILVEMGSCGNTLDEAITAAKFFTECLIDVFKSLK